jgi:deoxycytidine triphosphate deaminase
MDIEDKKFDKLLEEKRHKELLESLKKIAALLTIEDDTLIQAIDKQAIGIDLLNKNLSDYFGKSDKNVVDLSTVNKTLESLKIQKPTSSKWEFDIVRDKDGLIQSIKAKQA